MKREINNAQIIIITITVIVGLVLCVRFVFPESWYCEWPVKLVFDDKFSGKPQSYYTKLNIIERFTLSDRAVIKIKTSNGFHWRAARQGGGIITFVIILLICLLLYCYLDSKFNKQSNIMGFAFWVDKLLFRLFLNVESLFMSATEILRNRIRLARNLKKDEQEYIHKHNINRSRVKVDMDSEEKMKKEFKRREEEIETKQKEDIITDSEAEEQLRDLENKRYDYFDRK
jgi:hypothetical protein